MVGRVQANQTCATRSSGPTAEQAAEIRDDSPELPAVEQPTQNIDGTVR
jgi:hypothetical protein